MPLLSAWAAWGQRCGLACLSAVLGLAWLLAVDNSELSRLRSAFKGSAQRRRLPTVRPRRARTSLPPAA